MHSGTYVWRLDSKHNPQSHLPIIYRIPSDMLGKLFSFIVMSDDDYDSSRFHIRYKTISTFRRVSRNWNQVMLSTPGLWRRIAVDVSSRSSRYPPPDTVYLWIHRATVSQTLEILISMPSDQDITRHAHVRGIMNVLKPQIYRWSELWFRSEVGVLGFPQDLSQAHSLTKLSIDGIIDEDAIKSIGPTLHNFPGTIRDLCLDVATFDGMFLLGRRYEMRVDRLERLRLRYEGWMQGILNILSDTRTSLISANVFVDGQWTHSTEYHSFALHNPRIYLDSLRNLKLRIYDANVDLFTYLEINSLRVVDISVNWSTIPEHAKSIAPLIDFVENRSPSLRTCTMQFDELPSDWGTMAFRSPVLLRLRTYKIYNVELENVTREAIANSAPVGIITRICITPEANSTRFTIGWG